MNPLRLGRIAAEAEGVRLRLLATRIVIRVILGLVALAFLAGTVLFFHVAAWFWIRRILEAPEAALVLAGADLVVAIALGLLAARSSPGRVEQEALAVRQRAWHSVTSGLAFTTLATQLVRMGLGLARRARR